MKTRLLIFLVILLDALPSLTSSGAVLYVDLNSSSPAYPYSDWKTAATNIQDAIDAAKPGDQVIVFDGVYQAGSRVDGDGATNRVAITKAVSVVSVNGSPVTVIDGGGSMRCVLLTNGRRKRHLAERLDAHLLARAR